MKMSGWAVAGALMSLVIGACHGTSCNAECNCPDGTGEATLHLACAATPVVTTSEMECTAQQPVGSDEIFVTSGVAGTCHVVLTFAGGATLSTDIDFTPGAWLSCGSNPHGCGQNISASPSAVPIANVCVDAGLDGGSSG
jgi:hypothetical protein